MSHLNLELDVPLDGKRCTVFPCNLENDVNEFKPCSACYKNKNNSNNNNDNNNKQLLWLNRINPSVQILLLSKGVL